MVRTLKLPNGETVTPEDVFLYNNYPYRVQFPEDGVQAEYEFEFSPLYWGGGEMDIPFRDREALVEQWGDDSRGTMTGEEWDDWLREARGDERFGDDELDALARELPTESDSGLMARLRDALRF